MEMIRPGRSFDFMGKRRYFIAVSVLLVVLSIVSFFKPGIHLGTDFRGGTEVEVAFLTPISAAEVRAAVERGGFSAPDVVSVDDPQNPNRFFIRVQEVTVLSEAQRDLIRLRLCLASDSAAPPVDACPAGFHATEVKFSPGGEKISVRYEHPPDVPAITARLQAIQGVELRPGERNPQVISDRDHKVEIYLKSKGDQLVDGLRAELGAERVPAQALRVEWIGPRAGAQLRDAAIKSVIIALFFIMAYVAVRFDLRFAPGGILALAHDVVVTMGAMAITRREVTLSTVAAVLTIVGYSINDTVIVYDRIRENLPRHREKSFSAIINLSVSEMLGRTIITSGVTALSLIAFLWWGTGALQDFAFALLVGIAAGTYSSIYVAAQVTDWIDKRFFRGSAARVKAISRKRAVKRSDAVV